VLDAVRELQAAEKVSIIPSMLPETLNVQPVGEKGELLTTLVASFRVVDGDSGAEFTAYYPGSGTDKLDKGAYKAMTGAGKYFLLKLYQIPTRKDAVDPEQESHAEQGTGRRPAGNARPLAPAAAKPAPAATAPAQATTGASNARPLGPRPVAAPAASQPSSGPAPAAAAPLASQPVATQQQAAMPASWKSQPIVLGELPAMSAPTVTIREVVKRGEGTHPARGPYVAYAVFTEEGQRLGAIDEGGVAIGTTLCDAWKAGRTKVTLKLTDTQIGPKIIGVRIL
jgi:hypothetical protein